MAIFELDEPFTVNQQTAGLQYSPEIAGLTNGTYVVTWSTDDPAQDGSGYAIKAQLFGADGVRIGNEFLVNTTAAENQYGAVVAALSNGNFVISWTHDGKDSYGQVFSPTGAKLGAEFTVHTVPLGYQSQTSIAPLADGGFVATWSSGVYDTSVGYAQIYSATGAKIGARFAVETGGTVGFLTPTVTELIDGTLFIGWRDYSYGNFERLKGRLFDSDGTPITGELTLANGYASSFDVTALGDGGYAVTWVTRGMSFHNDNQLFVQVFDADGSSRGTAYNLQLNGPNLDFTPPQIVATGNGGFVVSYETVSSNPVGDPAPGARIQQFDATGHAVGAAMPAESTSALATLADGSRVVGVVGPSTRDGDISAQAYVIDPPASVAIADFSVPEGVGPHQIVVPVTRQGDVSQALTLTYVLSDGSAIGGQDYFGTQGSVTFAAGSATAAIPVTIVGNTVPDPHRTFNVALSDPLGQALIYPATAEIAILDAQGIHGGKGDDLVRGTPGNDYIFGEGGDDTLLGGEGNDYLFGGGGLNPAIPGSRGYDRLYGEGGADTLVDDADTPTAMLGGDGNDTYLLENSNSYVVEYAHNGLGGVDWVHANFSYVLGAQLENLTLTGTGDVDGTGNAKNNIIVGNDGANRIDGGGAGDDRLGGGGGNDVLIGGTGRDRLNGGTGADHMVGGDGNDSYVVDNVGDTILEWHRGGAGGADTVEASISFVLPTQVESLLLTGTANLNGTGNVQANALTGNVGENILEGLGGNDWLKGGAGADTFVLSAAAANGFDRIVDFIGGEDRIAIRAADYGVAPGTDAEDLFQIGSAVSGRTAGTFLFDPVTRVLSYDIDGTGAASPQALAVLGGQMTAGDLYIL